MDCLGVSLHHSVGGRPLWLIVGAPRGGAAPQAAATIAGHRLARVVAGWCGHMQLDAATHAYFTRVSEVTVVASYAASGDPQAAQAAGEAVRAALVDACGGKPADVTLAALAKRGLEVQLTARRAASGYGRVAGIAHSKFDLAAVQLGPEGTDDRAGAADVRAANDPVAPGALAAALEAAATAVRRSDTLGESFKALRLPSYAVGGAGSGGAGPTAGALLRAAKRRAGGGGALLQLLPPMEGDGELAAAAPPPAERLSPAATPAWGRRGGFGYDDDDDDDDDDGDDDDDESAHLSDSEDGDDDSDDDSDDGSRLDDGEDADAVDALERGGTARMPDTAASNNSSSGDGATAGACAPDAPLAVPTAAAAAVDSPLASSPHEPTPLAVSQASRGAAAGSPESLAAAAAVAAASPPPPLATWTLPLRLAFLHSESVTLACAAGGTEACSIEGSLVIRGSVEGGALPPALLASGHAPLALRVRLRPAQALASLTYTPASAAALQQQQQQQQHGASPDAGAPAAGVARSIVVSGAEPVELTLTVPGRPPARQQPPVSREQLELGSLHYKLAPAFSPQVLKAAASCKFAFGPAAAAAAASAPPPAAANAASESAPPQPPPAAAPQQPQQHRFTDVIVKVAVHPAVAGVSGAQLLVQLPPPALKLSPGDAQAAAAAAAVRSAPDVPPPPSAPAPGYEPHPQMKPPAQWNAQRGQLLWSISDSSSSSSNSSSGGPAAGGAGSGAGAPESTPVAAPQPLQLRPGVPVELRARVPVAHGAVVADAAPYAAVHGVPLQVRLTLPGTVLAPLTLEGAAHAADEGQSDGASGTAGGGGVRPTVVAVASKAQSRLTATYKA